MRLELNFTALACLKKSASTKTVKMNTHVELAFIWIASSKTFL